MTTFAPAESLTHETAATQMAAGIAAIDAGQTAISLELIKRVDSSAVACMLEWKRHAGRRGASLAFQHLPQNLTHLISLYGVEHLL
jgi:phospholipid transport system transporter-binding protein